ncbi:protein-disulfide reductase DsbD [uncultured Cardiobacterium sp.]|uniref:protein-disulfide reductase DsbD n=1 Tax=uncultured Cardiobacterium sp. TaxID=417619 RepID=UPI002610981B|nr:protein-disulfide reductase DsbD [uncultured Cardiobacterium sp.]
MTRLLWFFTALFPLFAHAAEPLPAEEVFKPVIRQLDDGDGYLTKITIDFPQGYYLYADKTTLQGADGMEERSPAEAKDDPYLGQVMVWHTPPTITLRHRDAAHTFTLTTQGCQENVLCYPPTTWTLHAEPAATARPQLFKAANRDVLPEEEAFTVSATETDGELALHYRMPDGYYLYRHSLRAAVDGKPLDLPLPAGEVHQDEFLGEQQIYRGALNLSLPRPAAGGTLTLHLQGCAEGRICYPPMTRDFPLTAAPQAVKTPAQAVAAAPPDATTSTIDRLIRRLNDNFLISLPLVLLLGIGVSFTACVYPLVPIVTSLVVGPNTGSGRAYRLITVYVLAMGAAMGLLGAVFGIFQINLQVILQKPWITALVALLFAGLSLSLFDVYTLQTPRWLQKPVDKLNRRQQGGSYGGAAVMGALSVLVVSPCATPVLTALLLFTTQTGPLKGATALFVFGLGTGLPLLLFAGAFRRFMPKAGAWMDNVKKAFAFALLAIGVWLVARILPPAWALTAWALYAMFAAAYLYGDSKTRRFLAGSAFIAALALGMQSANLHLGAPAATAPQAHNAFRTVDSVAALEAAIATSDRPVLLDFYADWCVACKKWEAQIWNNPDFAAPLAPYTLLKIDVTDFTAEHKAMFNALNLVGPPAVLYYLPHGKLHAPAETLIGEMTPDAFAAKLRSWAE